MKGWDERIALNAQVVATVTARRGEARWKCGDVERLIDEEAIAWLSDFLKAGEPPMPGFVTFYMMIDGRFDYFFAPASRADALLATMRAALTFSKGG